MTTRPLIALDADGVLLDYSLAYGHLWERAFGYFPKELDKDAYWPMDRWEVEALDGEKLSIFKACMDEQFWSTIPAVEHAVQACHRLHDAGFNLVCVSALRPQFQSARLRNLRDAGFPIERVIATGRSTGDRSPKAEAIEQLGAAAFVDDYLPYFKGIKPGIHLALVCRGSTRSPNVGPDLEIVHSQHASLSAFADWMLRSGPGNFGIRSVFQNASASSR